uniref:Chromo domain-containing protein n=1 Tax=Dunaliella tertiolecta TaxID=3047 RepID=A0A7S3QM81_DUNTE
MVNSLVGKKAQGRKKGSLWDLYSHIIEGRILCKPDGTKGVVCCFKYHDYSLKYAAVYQVRWERTRTSVDVPAHLVEKWCTDVFANETWVPKKIRAAQLANWHGDKVEQYMDSPLLKVHQKRRHSESDAHPAPPNKKAKSNVYGVQHSIFVSPPKAGRPRDMASELQQATKVHMEAASRRNCRSVHQPNPEHGSAEAEGNGGHSAGGEQGGGEGFLGQLRNVCSRLIGGGAGGGGVDASNSTGASPPSASEDVPAPEKSAAADTNARSPAAAAVQMGAATTLVVQGPAAKAGNSSKTNGTKKGKAKASTQGDEGDDDEKPKADEEEWVLSWTGKVYPRSVCCRPGDKLIKDMTMDELQGDFEAECIVDEFVSKKYRWYLIKYKGYELRLGNGENDKGDWEVQKNVKGTEAYRQWKRSKPAYFHQLVGSQAKPPKYH